MIYNKLDGTTSSRFKIGKSGPVLEKDTNKLRVIAGDYEFIIGDDEIENILGTIVQDPSDIRSIAS